MTAFLLIATVASFNFLIDPFGIWHEYGIEGINALKPQRRSQERTYKVGLYNSNPQENIILGSSIAEISLNPAHMPQRGINLATVGQRLSESARLLEWAANKVQLHEVLYSAEFYTSNMCLSEPEGLKQADLNSPLGLHHLVSIDTLGESLETIIKQSSQEMFRRRKILDERGMWVWADENVQYPNGLRAHFIEAEKNYDYFAPPNRCYSLAQFGRSAQHYFQLMFELSYRRGINLTLVISPSHVREREIIYSNGLWSEWENWKRMIVRTNEEVARKANHTPFVIWDFSDYNSITTEEVPGITDMISRMKFYWDPIHYRELVGDTMLSRIYQLSMPGIRFPEGFGKKISVENIEQWLAHIRRGRSSWAEAHPVDVGEVRNRLGVIGNRPMNHSDTPW